MVKINQLISILSLVLVQCHVFFPVVCQYFSRQLFLFLNCYCLPFVFLQKLFVLFLIAKSHVIVLGFVVTLWESHSIHNSLFWYEQGFNLGKFFFARWATNSKFALLHSFFIEHSSLFLQPGLNSLKLVKIILRNDFINYTFERIRLVDSQVCEYFTIKLNIASI